MPNFKVGSVKRVRYDPNVLSSAMHNTWRATDRNAVDIVDTTIQVASSFPLGMGYVSEGAYSVRVRPSGHMYLSGLRSKTPEELRLFVDTDSELRYFENPREPFERAALTIDQASALRSFIGYPVEIEVSGFQYGELINNPNFPDISARWYADNTIQELGRPNVPYFAIRGDASIIGWLGELNADASELELLDASGEPLVLPETMQITTGIDFTERLSELELQTTPPWFIPGTTRWAFLRDDFNAPNPPPPMTFLVGERHGLFADVFGQENTSTINGCRRISVITDPGRIDSNGMMQPFLVPADTSNGPIPLTIPLPFSEEIDRKNSFRARVVSSEVTPEVIDQFTGFVASISRHVLVMQIPDRASAGLLDTPSAFRAISGPLYEIDGVEYFVTSMVEGTGNSVTITLETEPSA